MVCLLCPFLYAIKTNIWVSGTIRSVRKTVSQVAHPSGSQSNSILSASLWPEQLLGERVSVVRESHVLLAPSLTLQSIWNSRKLTCLRWKRSHKQNGLGWTQCYRTWLSVSSCAPKTPIVVRLGGKGSPRLLLNTWRSSWKMPRVDSCHWNPIK